MIDSLQLQPVYFGNYTTQLYIPNPETIRQQYLHQQKNNPTTPFPFWAQLWPAAIAMAQFIKENPVYCADKTVLELAAGLGLPSIVAAEVAEKVICTDYLPESVLAIEQSIQHHNLINMKSDLLDWNDLTLPFPEADVVLLSDINYNPKDFNILYRVLKGFVEQGTTVILTTPQRLLAKSFIELILPWCRLQEELMVTHLAAKIPITVLVLTK